MPAETTSTPATTTSIPDSSVTTGANPMAGNSPAVPTFETLAPMALASLLPTNYADDPSFQKHGTFQELLDGYKHAQKFIGKDPQRLAELPLFGSETYADDLKGLLSRLGAPEKAEDYKFEVGDDLPRDLLDDFGPASEFGKWLQQTAHEQGLLPAQANALYGGLMSRLSEAAQADATDEATRKIAAETALKGQLGQAYEPSMAGMKAIDTMLGGKFLDALGDAATNPMVVAGLGKIGQLLGEPNTPMDRVTQSMPKTPDQLRSEARALQDKIPELRKRGIAGMAEAQRISERAMELYKQAAHLG